MSDEVTVSTATSIDQPTTSPQVQNVSPISTSTQKSNSGMGCFLKGCITMIVLGGIVLASGSFFIYSALKNISTKQDLGVVGDEAGFETFLDEIGMDVQGINYEDFCLTCPHLNYEGSHEATITISEQDASSWFQTVNVSPIQLAETQFNINADGSIELSTYATYQGTQYPIYGVGTLERTGEQSIQVSVSELEVGTLSLPANVATIASEFLTETANSKLGAMTGLRIDDLRIEEGNVVFEGAVPDKASY